MIWMIAISILITMSLLFSKSLWNRLLSLSSLSVKISVLLVALAWKLEKGYMVDLGVLYIMIGGAGLMVMIIFLLGRGME